MLAGIFDLQILLRLYSFGIYKYETAEKRGGEAVAKLAFMAVLSFYVCSGSHNIFTNFNILQPTSAQPPPKLYNAGYSLAGYHRPALEKAKHLKPKKKSDEAYEQ